MEQRRQAMLQLHLSDKHIYCLLRRLITEVWRNISSQHDEVMENFSRYWPFVRGSRRSLLNSPHKGQWRGALMFSLICAWINVWVNNREAGDLRHHRAHYDVNVMNNQSELQWPHPTHILHITGQHCWSWRQVRINRDRVMGSVGKWNKMELNVD